MPSNHIDPLGEFTAQLGVPGFVNGTTTTVTIATASTIVIDGKPYASTANANIAHPTTDALTGEAFPSLALSQGTIIVYMRNAALTLGAVQGSIETLDAAGFFTTNPQLPAIPEGWCPMAYVVVQIGLSGAAWNAATSTKVDATGVEVTWSDITLMPNRLVGSAVGVA